MNPEIVGREAELSSLRAFVEQDDGRSAALVLEGEPGIGKSTLWLAGVEQARARGLRVLTTRPSEAERGLAHAGLGDLFEDALDDVLPTLAPPRRRALEVALLLEDASEDPVDHRALAVAVRSALEALSEQEPVVVAVDDVQWLDPSSAGALAFALRRLEEWNVRVLLARRLVAGVEASELESVLPTERVEIGPLSVGAVHRLLSDRLGRSFARQTLLRIHEQSGGNPFFALEIARALDGDVDPLEPLPVPPTLEGLVRVRLTGLPPTTRDALGLAAAIGTPSEVLLEQAGVPEGALDPALAAHVVERDDGMIRFTHPLLSSALYTDLGDQRQSVHARIADLVADPVVRARHLALSSDEPDAEIALTLDEAAIIAADRGASAEAAELSEQALRLTPEPEVDERGRRALAAARAHQAAGEWTRARTIATSLADAELGPVRAEALIVLAELESIDGSIGLLEEALLEAESSPVLQADIQIRLASAIRFREGFVKAHERAGAALELAERLDDDSLRVRALAVLADLGAAIGDEDAQAQAAKALELAGESGQPRLEHPLAYVAAIAIGDEPRRRQFLEDEYERWRERDEPRSADALWELSLLELQLGSWDLAAEHAVRAREIGFQYGIEIPQHHLPIAWIAVHRGQLDLARETSTRALELAEQQLGLHPPYHLSVIGLVALWGGDASTGAEWLGRAHSRALGARVVRPRQSPVDRRLCRCAARARPDRRGGGGPRHDGKPTRGDLGDREILVHVLRCRGQIAAARGDIDEAMRLLDDAVARHEEVSDPYGRARALLALGVIRRRARQKRPARDAILEALAGFEQLGAETWIERCTSELGSIGGRTREEGLTPAERRVAALVAEGRTNREVAAALFLGERTVASHLTHIYAKLGIRSRTELARVLD